MEKMIEKWKQIRKKKRFKVVVVVIVITIVAIAMAYCAGLRITYAPELENNWDSISAYAAWFSVVVSIVGVGASLAAVWYAIQVPKQIAEEQNDIALFEKRYEILCLYSSCRSFANTMKTLKEYKIEIDKVKIREIFVIVFFDGKTDKDYNNFELIRMKNDEILDKMERSKFLFEYDISSYIRISSIVLHSIVISALDRDAQFEDNYIPNLIGLMDDKKYEAIVKKMEAKLTLR